MKRGANLRFATLLSLMAGVGLLVLLVRWYGSDLNLSFTHLQPIYVVLYLIALPIVVAAYSARWGMLARSIGGPIGLGKLMAARLAGDAVGALMPPAKVAGDPIRIALVRGEGLSLVSATAGVTLDRLCEVAGNVLAAAAYTMIFIASTHAGPHTAVSNLLASVIFLCAAVAVPVIMLWRGVRPLAPLYWMLDGRLPPRWARLLDGARGAESRVLVVFRDHPGSFVAGVVASLLIECLVIVEYQLLLRMCGIALPLSTLLLALVLGGLSRSWPSPAALGALEASQVAALTIAGQPAAAGLAVGFLIRLHETLLTAVGLGVCVARGITPGRLRLLAPADRGVA